MFDPSCERLYALSGLFPYVISGGAFKNAVSTARESRGILPLHWGRPLGAPLDYRAPEREVSLVARSLQLQLLCRVGQVCCHETGRKAHDGTDGFIIHNAKINLSFLLA